MTPAVPVRQAASRHSGNHTAPPAWTLEFFVRRRATVIIRADRIAED